MVKKDQKQSKSNPVIRFFASVRLAIFLLITLALTSIIGTVLPQGQPLQFYERYGPTLFKLIQGLHLNDTYHSWWYVTLLVLFSINLVVCTFKRLPYTLQLYKRDNLNVTLDKLKRMRLLKRSVLPKNISSEQVVSEFKDAAGGHIQEKPLENGKLVLSEKGKWSYWGLYALHGSILVIFAGALLGILLGFKGSATLLEGESTTHCVQEGTGKPIPLGFTLRCDKFTLSYYKNGMPKDYRSDLTIIDKGKVVLHDVLRVNHPLEYKGITIYQASYQAIPKITLKISSSDGRQSILDVPAFERITWPSEHVALGIMRYLPDVHGVPAAQLWWSDDTGRPPVAIWLLKGEARELKRGNHIYQLSMLKVDERYMTGLEIKKDPGVWLVWIGCALLIIGFLIVFWASHRRIWLWVGEEDGKKIALMAGTTNKNRMRFEKDFETLSDKISYLSGGSR